MTWIKKTQTTTPTEPTTTLKLAGKSWNALGDSITFGQGTTKPYHQYIKEWQGMGTVTNYGVSGRKISGTGGMAESYTSMTNGADLVTLLGGINDANDGTTTLGTMADRTVSTFYGACHVLFKGLRLKYANTTTRIVIFTPLAFDAFPDSDGFADDTTFARVKSFADAMVQVAERYSIPCYNLFANSETNQSILHPDATFHQIMATKMMNFILQQF